MPNAKQPRWRAKKSTALAIRLQLAKNEHDESAGSSKARENFAIFVKTKAETKTLNRKIRLRHVRHDPSRLVAREQLWDNVRFTPESGHQLSALGCPLCAKSARRAPPIREAAFASLKAPLRPVPVPVDPMDGNEEREASGRRRILQCDNRKTNARPAQSS
jgi:hypothetical protein